LTAKKQRLDVLLHENGYFESRERAKAAIMAGQVRVNGEKADKPGTSVEATVKIEITGSLPYVSRGGLKLEKALRCFGIDLNHRILLDVGASTGGFTDCALQNGASRVYAVDVGYGQLAWKLRSDPRVVVFERTNIKKLQPFDLEYRPDFVTIDVSFISLDKVIPPVALLVDKNARGMALIKPQFEAGRGKVGKKGVVRDREVHREVIDRICKFILDNGWSVLGLDFSPIRGPEGNIEYLLYFSFKEISNFDINMINKTVGRAHSAF